MDWIIWICNFLIELNTSIGYYYRDDSHRHRQRKRRRRRRWQNWINAGNLVSSETKIYVFCFWNVGSVGTAYTARLIKIIIMTVRAHRQRQHAQQQQQEETKNHSQFITVRADVLHMRQHGIYWLHFMPKIYIYIHIIFPSYCFGKNEPAGPHISACAKLHFIFIPNINEFS